MCIFGIFHQLYLLCNAKNSFLCTAKLKHIRNYILIINLKFKIYVCICIQSKSDYR
jgi:hypothetical protein